MFKVAPSFPETVPCRLASIGMICGEERGTGREEAALEVMAVGDDAEASRGREKKKSSRKTIKAGVF